MLKYVDDPGMHRVYSTYPNIRLGFLLLDFVANQLVAMAGFTKDKFNWSYADNVEGSHSWTYPMDRNRWARLRQRVQIFVALKIINKPQVLKRLGFEDSSLR